MSRSFVAASAAKLKEFQERDLKVEHYVALFPDGKSFADTLLVIALGVTAEGTKRFLGFVETHTEHDKVLASFLRTLVARSLDFSQGLLVVVDGGKGLRSALRNVFQKKALVQRRRALRQGRLVEDLEPAAALAGDRVARHRTKAAAGQGASPSPAVDERAGPPPPLSSSFPEPWKTACCLVA